MTDETKTNEKPTSTSTSMSAASASATSCSSSSSTSLPAANTNNDMLQVVMQSLQTLEQSIFMNLDLSRVCPGYYASDNDSDSDSDSDEEDSSKKVIPGMMIAFRGDTQKGSNLFSNLFSHAHPIQKNRQVQLIKKSGNTQTYANSIVSTSPDECSSVSSSGAYSSASTISTNSKYSYGTYSGTWDSSLASMNPKEIQNQPVRIMKMRKGLKRNGKQ